MSFSIRVFDSVLDNSKHRDTVTRNSADFWRAFCYSAGWGFSYERVHSVADLKYFFGKKIHEDVIIFGGHGIDKSDDGNGKGWCLSNDERFEGTICSSDEGEQKVPPFPDKNHDKIVIFSACKIGNNEVLSQGFSTYFNSKYLFAYRHIVHDQGCFLLESILLSELAKKAELGKRFSLNDFTMFQKNTMFLKSIAASHARVHPLAMY